MEFAPKIIANLAYACIFLQSRIHIKAAKKNIANPEGNNTYVLV